MDLNYNLFNILMLLGAIQGFILCFFIYQKRKLNIWAVRYFILFLFSISFFNFIYACLNMDLFRYYRPLHMTPIPYKWLIGIGFYFYIRHLFQPKDNIPYHKKLWFLFIPAILYFFLRLYWFSIAIKENSYRITEVIVNSNFFRYHEYAYLLFCLILGISAYKIVTKHKNEKSYSTYNEQLKWLSKFIIVFISIVIANLLLFSADLFIHEGSETWNFAYPTFICNTLYIYWIGFIGFTKIKLLFPNLKPQKEITDQDQHPLSLNIEHLIINKELYTNPNFSLTQAATILGVSPKKLSSHINTSLGINFSEFLNYYRTEKVKQLLSTPEAKKYTLFSLAEQAGFKTKSSFNATFKRLTGMTPSAYKKANA